jgi:hypothetical protein
VLESASSPSRRPGRTRNTWPRIPSRRPPTGASASRSQQHRDMSLTLTEPPANRIHSRGGTGTLAAGVRQRHWQRLMIHPRHARGGSAEGPNNQNQPTSRDHMMILYATSESPKIAGDTVPDHTRRINRARSCRSGRPLRRRGARSYGSPYAPRGPVRDHGRLNKAARPFGARAGAIRRGGFAVAAWV